MRNYAHILVLGGLLAAACTAEPVQEPAFEPTPVLFTVGDEELEQTKASVPYMALDSRFVCSMYYHAAASATTQEEGEFDLDAAITSAFQVNNNQGNAVCDPSFYWHNRLTHAFLAVADYNKLQQEPVLTDTYDLTRGARTSMEEQPDPIQALTLQKPAGSTPEANRVRLYFKHQFSQIQVNLKGSEDNSASLTAGQIDKVELLGVSEKASVSTQLKDDGSLDAAKAQVVNLDAFSDAQLKENKWGTSFDMFTMDEAATGYLKSFNAIAFGRLSAIRLTWHEDGGSGVVHVSTFEVPETNESHVPLQVLKSGMRYIYDLEIRRGLLAVIRAEIKPWQQKESLVVGADGTITN